MPNGRRRSQAWGAAALLAASTLSFPGCAANSPAAAPAPAVTTDRAPVKTEEVTLSASVQRLDRTSGAVAINGVDTRRPTKPFQFDWGDRTSSQNFFPATHIYVDLRRNYTVTITATYDDGTTQTISIPVTFVDGAPAAPPPKSRR